ncbi:MAG: hypothetical protein ACRDZO_15890, partial [Egibacteraceae bacterium]
MGQPGASVAYAWIWIHRSRWHNLSFPSYTKENDTLQAPPVPLVVVGHALQGEYLGRTASASHARPDSG